MDTNKIFIDMAQRAHEFAEMCRLMQKIPDMPLTAEVKDALDEYAKRLGLPKADPEAWREEFRKKQAAGVKFECFHRGGDLIGQWVSGNYGFNGGNKEDYREVPQEVQKEGDMRIPEASREVLKQWQANGLKFNVRGIAVRGVDIKFTDIGKNIYTISEQPIPEGMSVEMVEAMWRHGLKLEYYRVDIPYNFKWYNGHLKGAEMLANIRIPFQPIPEKLLEVPQEPHAAERALWKAQREAGTNEVWQEIYEIGTVITTYPVDKEPAWDPNFTYRVKPMKLTAKIIRREFYPRMAQPACLVQNWEFAGTREEYRAECEKYGYVVISEIKEVKPKTVKYYFALYKTPDGCIGAEFHEDKQRLTDWIITCCGTIIGDIEEREIEV